MVAQAAGASTTMVEPCSNQPISSPLRNGASQRMTFGPRYRRSQQHVEEMQPDARDQDRRDRHQRDERGRWRQAACACTARSFLQNSFSTRFSAIGLTFQVSPEMYVTCSTRQSCGAWKR